MVAPDVSPGFDPIRNESRRDGTPLATPPNFRYNKPMTTDADILRLETADTSPAHNGAPYRPWLFISFLLHAFLLLPLVVLSFMALRFFSTFPENPVAIVPVIAVVAIGFYAITAGGIVAMLESNPDLHSQTSWSIQSAIAIVESVLAGVFLIVVETCEYEIWLFGTPFSLPAYLLLALVLLGLWYPIACESCTPPCRRTLLALFLACATVCYLIPWERMAPLPDRTFAIAFSRIQPGMLPGEVQNLLDPRDSRHEPAAETSHWSYYNGLARYTITFSPDGHVTGTFIEID